MMILLLSERDPPFFFLSLLFLFYLIRIIKIGWSLFFNLGSTVSVNLKLNFLDIFQVLFTICLWLLIFFSSLGVFDLIIWSFIRWTLVESMTYFSNFLGLSSFQESSIFFLTLMICHSFREYRMIFYFFIPIKFFFREDFQNSLLRSNFLSFQMCLLSYQYFF